MPVPKGESSFLFHPTKGKTRPVKTFYDTRCSHAVFQEVVLGGQVRGQLVTIGPFDIGGVGGLTVSELMMNGLLVRREWMSERTEFPTINLTAAVADINAADSSNQLLQRCQVPQFAGGSVDMLLESKYFSIFRSKPASLSCLG